MRVRAIGFGENTSAFNHWVYLLVKTTGAALKALFALVLFVGLPAISVAQQEQQTTLAYHPHLANPAYGLNGPVVAIDEAHSNFHTLGGRYAPFGALASADGYRVERSTVPFSPESLRGIDVLVIANALPPKRNMPAFSPDEIEAVKQWVAAGSSLLLIADHAPFGTAAAPLAAAFGVEMGRGFVVATQNGQATANIRYSGKDLGIHPIINGRYPKEHIRAVTAFTGQSLAGPPSATSILIIPAGALEVEHDSDIDSLARGGSAPAQKAGGRSQLLALPFGKGRLVVSGEAAMFTAQRLGRNPVRSMDMGLMVDDDRQFALNVLHWLSRLVG